MAGYRNKMRNNFDSNFTFVSRMVKFVFVIVILMFIGIIGFWCFVGWGVATHSDDIGRSVGSFARSIEEGFNGK